MTDKRVLLLLGKTAYDAMNIYLRELGKAFVEMGYIVDYLDGREEGFPDKLYEYTSNNNYKFIMACNAIIIGYDKLVLGDSIYCCLMFDHPICHFERLDVADERVVVIHCDLRGAEYIAKYCTSVGSVGFVPLSGSYVEDRVEYSKRKYDLVFTGSYNDSGKIYKERIEELSAENKRMADELIYIMQRDPSLTEQDALEILFNNSGIDVIDRQFHLTMARLSYVEAYMRAWIREQVIRSIVDAGITINIFGRGWEKFECRHPEKIIQMEGYGEDSLRVIANAKIALNVMPWFRGGFQERIASAMLCGAVALTDTSTYIEENFTDGEDIALYDPAHVERIPDIINNILSDTQRAAQIAENGYNKAINGHTWKHRAAEIIEIIDDSIAWLENVRHEEAMGNIKVNPKVSVIVPVHNSEATLASCLGNLVNQTIDSIEIIIVDDCSTDGSRDMLESCKYQYRDRVKVIYLDSNVGPGGARNIGLSYASGDYIGFADSDDLADVTMYEKMYNKAVEGGYDIVDVAFYKEEVDETILYTDDDCVGILDDKKRSQLIFGAGGFIWAKLFNRKLFEDMPHTFRENCILEDCDFMLWMFAKARSIGTIKEVLYIYKYYPGSMSHNTELGFYYDNVIKAVNAIYDRLSVLDNYDGIKEAVEAIIYKLYSCTLNFCIVQKCNKKIIPGNEMIRKLVELKNKTTSGDYDNNKYVKLELEKADVNIMKQIDKLYL